MTIAELKKLSQQALDKLFQQKPAGSIPTGEAKGTALVLPGTAVTNIIADFIRITIWQGKVFERDANNPDRGVLQNKILPLGYRAIEASVYKDKSWFDGKECIVLDYSKTSLIAKNIRDEIREVQPGFYLGIVYWGRKRIFGFALETDSRTNSERSARRSSLSQR